MITQTRRNPSAGKAEGSQGFPTGTTGAEQRTTSSIPSRGKKVKAQRPLEVLWLDDLIPKGIAHVESRSQPGHYHDVDCLRGRCECTGFTMREKCAHVAAARADWPAAIAWRQRRIWAARREEVLLQAQYGDSCFVVEEEAA